MSEVLSPNYIGPSWATDDDGNFLLPEHTLGWEIAGWCSQYILDPNSSSRDPKPWHFTNEQLRILLWWYAVDDNGRFIYRQGVLQRMKGWGKDPLLAVMALVELCGPSRFDHWDAQGMPVAKPHQSSWVQIVAVSREQTRNTMRMFPNIISNDLKRDFSLDIGIEFIRANQGRCSLEAVTSSFRSLEGGRTTFSILNEIQHWVPGNQGNLMYETIDNNAAKGIESRYIAITNAYLPGEESVGETMRNAYNDILEGRAQNYGFMYDSIEANPKTELSPESLREVIPLIRGDSVWVDPDNIISSAMKTDVSPARSRRMWLNQIVADEDAVYQESDWDRLDSPDTPLRPGDEIVMGFDGGKSDDATALVAVRISDGYVEPILIEQRPPVSQRDHMPDGKPPHWEVNKDYVDSKVRATFSRYKVRGFYCDVALWEPYIADWAKDYGEGLDVKAPGRNACAWDMRNHLRILVQGHEALIQTVLDGKLKHAPYSESALAARMRRHVLNARRRENRFGVSFGKESPDSPKKVDAYAALLLAVMAWNDLKQRMPEQTTRRGFFF